MERHIQYFKTAADVQTALDEQELGKPYLAYLEDEKRLDWNSKSMTPPLSAQPLTIDVISADTITFKAQEGIKPTPLRTIEYSINNGGWIEVTSSYQGTAIPVSAGDKIQFRGDNSAYSGVLQKTQLKVNGSYKVYGNIASLISSTGFTDVSMFPDYCFSYLFQDETGLTEVTEIAFGNNIGTGSWHSLCFTSLFRGCANLTFVKTLAIGSFSTGQFSNWLLDTSPNGTFVKNSLSTYTKVIPEGWTVIDADI